MTVKIQGSVLPAGTLQLGGAWDDGVYTVTILEIQDEPENGTQMVKASYEDGFTKWHQIKTGDIAALLAVVANNVRGRHGVNTTIKKAPKKLAEDAVIELEVANG